MLYPRTKTSLISSINATGFLSIMIVLFFTVLCADRGPLYPHNRSRPAVDLPKVEHPNPVRATNREDTMAISITRDRKIYFRTEQVKSDQLPARIREGLRQGAEKKVYINADARAQYGSVKEALDAVRDAGVENVAFLADQRGLATINPTH